MPHLQRKYSNKCAPSSKHRPKDQRVMAPLKRNLQLFKISRSRLAVPLNPHHPGEGATRLRRLVPRPEFSNNQELARSPLKPRDRPLLPRQSSLNPRHRKRQKPHLCPQTLLLQTAPSRRPGASSPFFRAINKSPSRTPSVVRATLYQSALRCHMLPRKPSIRHQLPHRRHHPPILNPWQTGSTKWQARAILRQPKRQQTCNKLSRRRPPRSYEAPQTPWSSQ